MRVTYQQINNMVQRNLSGNFEKLAMLQEQMASGKKLNRPSDDPVSITNDLQVRARIKELDQFKNNIEDGLSILSVSSQALMDINPIMQRIREIGIQASNDVYGEEERGYMADEIQELLGQFVQILNTKYGGEYVFNGTNTDYAPYIRQTASPGSDPSQGYINFDASTAPVGTAVEIRDAGEVSAGNDYTYERIIQGTFHILEESTPGNWTEVSAVEGVDYNVDYAEGEITFNASMAPLPANYRFYFDHYGSARDSKNRPKSDSGEINRQIEENIIAKVNMGHSEIVDSGSINAIKSIVKFVQNLRENNSGAISSSMEELDVCHDKVLSAQSRMGAVVNRLDLTKERNGFNKIENTRLQANYEDVDWAEVVMEFSTQQNIYQASLKAGARVIMPTLGDFLG